MVNAEWGECWLSMFLCHTTVIVMPLTFTLVQQDDGSTFTMSRKRDH